MDEISPIKHISHVFAEVNKKRLHHSDRLGWLVRDSDNIWRPDEQAALQIARTFCAAAAKHMRDRRLDSEATVEAVMRLASFEPRMTAALPKGDTVLALSSQPRVA